ncbi:hypothetical protein IY145_21280 [Methylosinus sp. H3A]|uniref:hypothetical protein n=1 Tax=Methylosinus sp. H3A TaxID=2785786 RepID=UPI0018C2EAF7|nr:hypothetical protein [Methylosinus sp. H3A]MBG0811884.1 hypothetical protein [Methylosinus sp. H3A]
MNKEQCVLVCGVGERASAVARRLIGEGYATVLHQERPPRALRRRMCYADAWFDGIATLGGVEARRADRPTEFLCGMQTRQFLPLLLRPLEEVVERWPWDVIIAAPDHDGRPARSLANLAELTIGVGSGFVAGTDCDLVIATDGLDPGAVLRAGDSPPSRRGADRLALDYWDVIAVAEGELAARKTIGDRVEAEEILGFLGEEPVRAPVAGRISGLARPEQLALPGAPIAEIATSERAPVVGVADRNKLIARGVSFAVEMEAGGWTPVSIGSR